jgi:hypothetical protein
MVLRDGRLAYGVQLPDARVRKPRSSGDNSPEASDGRVQTDLLRRSRQPR